MPQARGMTKDFEETDPFFLWVEKNWAEPCTENMPKPLHGLCLFGPPLALAMLVILVVSTLAWCDKRSKAKLEAKPPPKATKETKKSK